jgi:hypothetical protein
MATRRSRDELFVEVLELIRPSQEFEAQLREAFDFFISIIHFAKKDMDGFTPPAIKAEITPIRGALKKVSALVVGLSPLARRCLFDEVLPPSGDPEFDDAVSSVAFTDDLDLLIRRSESFLDVDPRKGAPRRRISRMTAAAFAHSLITEYSPSRATLTKEGAFFRVASLLLEAATGDRDADLARHCRRVFDEKRTDDTKSSGVREFSSDT